MSEYSNTGALTVSVVVYVFVVVKSVWHVEVMRGERASDKNPNLPTEMVTREAQIPALYGMQSALLRSSSKSSRCDTNNLRLQILMASLPLDDERQCLRHRHVKLAEIQSQKYLGFRARGSHQERNKRNDASNHTNNMNALKNLKGGPAAYGPWVVLVGGMLSFATYRFVREEQDASVDFTKHGPASLLVEPPREVRDQQVQAYHQANSALTQNLVGKQHVDVGDGKK
ncbi:hypothetical protein PROFUN_04308 [Planoprotostelium fungivorum]|uniref:Transmembrane protein n=1 Tax=Planoprotostelium fungivorum TaxID=1890364 RepID=A0A2P6NV37_9EUKA|nr:hypothetical protein PROFUN_04308 [Planoprotostelium fungivorum]